MSTIEMQVKTKDKTGPVVNVPREPQDSAWFELLYQGFWYRGHVTNITYQYTSEAELDATLRTIVTIDAVTWAVADADLRKESAS